MRKRPARTQDHAGRARHAQSLILQCGRKGGFRQAAEEERLIVLDLVSVRRWGARLGPTLRPGAVIASSGGHDRPRPKGMARRASRKGHGCRAQAAHHARPTARTPPVPVAQRGHRIERRLPSRQMKASHLDSASSPIASAHLPASVAARDEARRAPGIGRFQSAPAMLLLLAGRAGPRPRRSRWPRRARRASR